MNDEKLILLVQSFDCIYNKYNPNYKNKEAKSAAWAQIAQEMRFPEEICLKRWSSLRDRYVKEKRQANRPSGSGASFKCQWPLMGCLEFLAPHVTSRPMRSSMNILDDTPSDIPSQLSVDFLNDSELESPLPTQYDYYGTTLNSQTSPQLTQYPVMEFIAPTSPVNLQSEFTEQNGSAFIAPQKKSSAAPKRKRKSSEIGDVDQVFFEAAGAFKKLCDTQKDMEKEEESNPLHGFGKMIVATIASMNSRKQVQTMQRVTELVMAIKLESDELEALNLEMD